MDTFQVISIVPVEHLTSLLRWLEARQLPYNVELKSVKKISASSPDGQSNMELARTVLSKGTKTMREIGDAFVASGRKRKAAYSAVHNLKKGKHIKQTKEGYSL